MQGTEFDEFAADIEANGLREPIWLTPDEAVLDGRNRWLACRKVDVEPTFRTYDGDDPIGFVVSLNLKRRHLSESQRAMIANLHLGDNQYQKECDLISTDTEGAPIGAPSVSIGGAAQMFNVGTRSIDRARVVQAEAAPNVVAAVDRGDVSVNAALTAVKATNWQAGSIEAGKKLQATWSPEDIAAAAKKAKADRLVKDAMVAEQEGRGNAVTKFHIEHRREPTAAEANEIAIETGMGVVDNCGIIQPPAARDFCGVL